PAQYPREPKGPKFSMFAAAGLLLGMVAPFGALTGLLQIDPRVRARKQLEEGIGLPVLIEIPQVRTPYEKRIDRKVTMLVGIFALCAAALYLAVVVLAYLGIISCRNKEIITRKFKRTRKRILACWYPVRWSWARAPSISTLSANRLSECRSPEGLRQTIWTSAELSTRNPGTERW